jgi:predicted glycogen debranching enzyme
MISLEGLTLVTGRHTEAGYILRTFGHYVQDGLIPNMFPEGEKQGLYHTADATLWFFHAVQRYLDYSGDRLTLSLLYPKLKQVIEHHVRGTRFGIHVDDRDGLLMQGAPGYQLTWMDAKVDDWVVTPRRGKPVEIQALWYNALRSLAELDTASDSYASLAEHVQASFRARFVRSDRTSLADVVDGPDGDDWSVRPNQIFAVSLPYPLLTGEQAAGVVDCVGRALLTSYGLRSLSPDEPAYRGDYAGDQVRRDGAYHQGPVWPWLIGAFVEAHYRVHADTQAALSFLWPFVHHIGDAGIGSISEIMEGDAPHLPRGCVAQAWSVAEVLRVYRALSA